MFQKSWFIIYCKVQKIVFLALALKKQYLIYTSRFLYGLSKLFSIYLLNSFYKIIRNLGINRLKIHIMIYQEIHCLYRLKRVCIKKSYMFFRFYLIRQYVAEKIQDFIVY